MIWHILQFIEKTSVKKVIKNPTTGNISIKYFFATSLNFYSVYTTWRENLKVSEATFYFSNEK